MKRYFEAQVQVWRLWIKFVKQDFWTERTALGRVVLLLTSPIMLPLCFLCTAFMDMACNTCVFLFTKRGSRRYEPYLSEDSI